MNTLKLRARLAAAVRPLVTLSVLAIAGAGGRALWIHYQVEPWTPDGRVRADVVQIAPDVSGFVTELTVVNDQVVKRGQPLFRIDRERYILALRQAQATLAAQQANLEQARRESARTQALGKLVAEEIREQGISKVKLAEAAVDEARVKRDLASLNLQRTLVVAPADGILSDLSLRVGSYVSAGDPVFALIDTDSLRVEGYFEETKLSHIRVGQPVRVKLMGDERMLTGHVQSIAAGIEDRDRAAGANLLPNVNPTFSWVRLAQRIPVRVALDDWPPDMALITGRTAIVAIVPAPETGANN